MPLTKNYDADRRPGVTFINGTRTLRIHSGTLRDDAEIAAFIARIQEFATAKPTDYRRNYEK